MVWMIVFGLFLPTTRGRIVHASTLPHGDFVYDPSLVHNANGSLALHGNATLLAASIAAAKPDIIFLITPHGLESTVDAAIYRNTEASGFALLGQDLHNASFPGYKVPLNVTLNSNVSDALIASLSGIAPAATRYSRLRGAAAAATSAATAKRNNNNINNNVSGLLAFAGGEPIALRWGEVIPLSFMRSYFATHSTASVVVWSQPTRRYVDSGAPMAEEMVTLGALVGAALEELPQRVAVIVSSDLAHTHLASGPYGKSTAAEPFDRAIATWARSLDPAPLLSTAKGLVADALSCGYTGLCMLHGMLTRDLAEGWTSTKGGAFAIAHPTYYGMLVAGWERSDEQRIKNVA